MIMARVIILAVVVVVSMVIAYLFKGITGQLLTTIQDGVGCTTWEAVIITLMRYIALVYLAVVRPVVDFWEDRRD